MCPLRLNQISTNIFLEIRDLSIGSVTPAFSARSFWNIRRAGSAAAAGKVCQIVHVSYLQLFLESIRGVGSRSYAVTTNCNLSAFSIEKFNLFDKCSKLRTHGYDDSFKTRFMCNEMFLQAHKSQSYLTKCFVKLRMKRFQLALVLEKGRKFKLKIYPKIK